MRVEPPREGVERMEAFFVDAGFSPHRHDTYAVGITTHGVQCFRYRGAQRHCTVGRAFVLHPDEVHDGQAGTAQGYGYRALHIEPGVILDALEGRARTLPFLRDPVSSNGPLLAALLPALADLAAPLEDLLRVQAITALADALAAGDTAPATRARRADGAVRRVRDYIDAHVADGVTSAALEAETGLSRYALARQFRACLGTSPYRYLVLRRLAQVRDLLRRGSSLAEAAQAAGFADQAHMTRHFKRAYGLTPARWSAMQRPATRPATGTAARARAPAGT